MAWAVCEVIRTPKSTSICSQHRSGAVTSFTGGACEHEALRMMIADPIDVDEKLRT